MVIQSHVTLSNLANVIQVSSSPWIPLDPHFHDVHTRFTMSGEHRAASASYRNGDETDLTFVNTKRWIRLSTEYQCRNPTENNVINYQPQLVRPDF